MRVNRVMAVLMAAVFVAGTAVSAAEGAKRIGVVNVSRVFQASQKVQQIQNRLKEQFEGKRNELEKKQNELKQDMMNVRAIQEKIQEGNTEEERKLFTRVQDIQGREFDLKLQIREVGKDVERVRMEEMKQVLKEIRAAIRDVGAAEKFDLIMRAPEYDDEGLPAIAAGAEDDADARAPKTAAELVRRFRENPVLYFEKSVDITDTVINKLNAEFQKTGPAKKN
jgi:Skp family chaperone for outer membrane proteins